MFKSTNQFFKKVNQNIVTEIEIDNYIETITKNYNKAKLQLLYIDLANFLQRGVYEIEENITDEEIENKIASYKKLNLEIPYKRKKNVYYLYAEYYNLPLDGIPEYDDEDVLDLKELFYKNSFNGIKPLFDKINFLIQQAEKMEQNEGLKGTKPLPETDSKNKSLILNGKPVNLSERFKIANKVFGISDKLKDLKIGDLKQYQLLAYTLGCDKDNARKLINGTYNSKDEDRDLTDYYKSLDLLE